MASEKLVELRKPKPDQNGDYLSESSERFSLLAAEPGPLDGLYAASDFRKLYYTNKYMENWVEIGDRPGEMGLPHTVVQNIDIYHDPLNPTNSRLRIATFGRGLWQSELVTNKLPTISITGVGGTCNQAVFTASVSGIDIATVPIGNYGWRVRGTKTIIDHTTEFMPPASLSGQPIVYEFILIMPSGSWLEGVAIGGETPAVLVTEDPVVRFSPKCTDGYFTAVAFVSENPSVLINGAQVSGDLGPPPVLIGSDFEHGIITIHDGQNQVPDGVYTLTADIGEGCNVVSQFTVWGNPSPEDSYLYGGVFRNDNFIHTSIEIGKDWVANPNTRMYFKGSYKYYQDSPGGRVFGTTLTLLPGANLTIRNNVLFTSDGVNCQNMWGGIRVASSSESQILAVGDEENSLNSSFIEHAFTGIRVEVDKSKVDGVNLDGVTFKDCYVGIEIVNNIAQENSKARDLKVFNSTFISNETEMKKPFDSGHSPDNIFMTQFGIFLNYKSDIVAGQIDGCNFVRNLVGIMSYEGSSSSSTCQFSEIGFAGIVTANGLNIPTRSVKSTFNFPPTSLINWQRVNFTTFGKYFSDASLENMHWNLPSNYKYQLSGLLVRRGLAQSISCTFTVSERNQDNLRYHGLNLINASGPADTDNNPSNDEDIKMNVFEGLDVGIRKDGEGKISIVGNTFLNNKRAIELGYSPTGSMPITGGATANISLNFKCNSFFTDETESRTGLLIENGVKVNGTTGDIGGPISYANGQGSANDNYPNANFFPIHDELPTLRDHLPEDGSGIPVNVQNANWGWPDAVNWKSLENQSPGNPIVYHRFVNEYVYKSTGVSGEVSTPFTIQKAYSAWNENQSIPTFDPLTDAKACEAYDNYDPTLPVFPTRIALVSVASKSRNQIELPVLGQAVPNPSVAESSISIYLPSGISQAELQVLETGTGKVLQHIPLKSRGELKAILTTANVAAGIYTIRLVADGKSVGTGKLVVVH